MITWFCEWRAAEESHVGVSEADKRAISALVKSCSNVIEASLLTSVDAVDPYYPSDPKAPKLVLVVRFGLLASLEDALGCAGPLHSLAIPGLFPSLSALHAVQEIMLGRAFPLPKSRAFEEEIAYLVTYTGMADDENLWHSHYLYRHRVILSKLPALSRLEIYTPATVIFGVPFPCVRSLQRNITAFPSLDLMKEAMQSEIRAELRRDFAVFPAFTGLARHEPYLSRPIYP